MCARRARALENNNCYKITVTGAPEQRLFEYSGDYLFYLHLLKKHKFRFRIKIYGFCLTPNVVSIVLQCEAAEQLSTFMQIINQVYAFYFNAKYKRNGKLYRDRFKSILLKEEQKVWAALNEIEFSPVRLQLVDTPWNYSWSSCYLRMAGKYGILDSLNTSISVEDSCLNLRIATVR